MTNLSRHTALFTVLLVLIISCAAPVAAAKHIIVIYDVSGSMFRLKTGKDTYNTYMEPEDIQRVNAYLTALLFTDAAQPLHDIDDTYIKQCDAAYVSKPLYQSGDVLTYAEYAKQRNEKISRKQVNKAEFQRELPDAKRMKESFYGRVSYLLRAETEVYDELYREADSETYWMFVTDGDIDNSGKSDTGIAAILKRLAEIEEEYYAPLLLSILVNNHVKIEVRKLQKRRDIDAIFIANHKKPDEPAEKLSLSNDDAGQFISETLVIDTKNTEKAKFKLETLTVEVVDKNRSSLQVANEDNQVEVLQVDAVPLRGSSPPYELRIPFPANPELATPGNQLKLEVTYTYHGVDKVHQVPRMNYTAVIDSVYISDVENPHQPAKQSDLVFSDDTYLVELVVRSESPNKDAFQINQVRAHVQYKDGRKLCAASVSNIPESLDTPFSVAVPKENDLDWYGNRLALDITYTYDGNPRFATIGVPFKLQGGGGGFPMWLLVIPLLILIGVLIYLIVQRIKPQPIEHQIGLAQVTAAGTLIGEKRYFTLTKETILAFGQDDDAGLHFDVGSAAFLYCDENTEILLFEEADADEGRPLETHERLVLKRSEDEEVHVDFEIMTADSDSAPEEGPEPFPIDNGSNPLDR